MIGAVPAHEAGGARRAWRSARGPGRGTGGTCCRAPCRSRARRPRRAAGPLDASPWSPAGRTPACGRRRAAVASSPARARERGSRAIMRSAGTTCIARAPRAAPGDACSHLSTSPEPRLSRAVRVGRRRDDGHPRTGRDRGRPRRPSRPARAHLSIVLVIVVGRGRSDRRRQHRLLRSAAAAAGALLERARAA